MRRGLTVAMFAHSSSQLPPGKFPNKTCFQVGYVRQISKAHRNKRPVQHRAYGERAHLVSRFLVGGVQDLRGKLNNQARRCGAKCVHGAFISGIFIKSKSAPNGS
jgi:hypothetical protein